MAHQTHWLLAFIGQGLLGIAISPFALAQPTVHLPGDPAKALAAMDIMNQHCSECHDGSGKYSADGGFDLANLGSVMSHVVAQQPLSSKLFANVIVQTQGQPPRMPEDNPPLNADEVKVLEEWINTLEPPKEVLRGCAGVDEGQLASLATDYERVQLDSVISDILSDVESLDDQRLLRSDVRYITLANFYNVGPENSQDCSLDIARAAISRGLNSVSKARRIAEFVPIDDKKLTYRFFLSDLEWTEFQWDQLMDEYPYRGYPTSVDTGQIERNFDQIAQLIGTRDPMARADWLLRIATHAGRYEKLLGIPGTVQELEKPKQSVNDPFLRLSVNYFESVRRNEFVRGGFGPDTPAVSYINADGQRVIGDDSGVSGASRIIERLESQFGYYWRSYDFNEKNGGNSAVPRQPFDKELLSILQQIGYNNFASEGFEHDGGEMIFELPNGLQGYLVTTAEGELLELAPRAIVNWTHNGVPMDRRGARAPLQAAPAKVWEFNQLGLYGEEPLEPDSIFNGIACMSCHATGMRKTTDFVGLYYSQPRGAIVGADGISSDEIRLIRSIYDGQRLNAFYDKDEATFANAVLDTYEAIGLTTHRDCSTDEAKNSGYCALVDTSDRTLRLNDIDPVSTFVRDYVYNLSELDEDLLKRQIASEFWIAPGLMEAEMNFSPTPAMVKMRQKLMVGQEIQRENGLEDLPGSRPFECDWAPIAETLGWEKTNNDLFVTLTDGASICRRDADAPRVVQAKSDVYNTAQTPRITAGADKRTLRANDNSDNNHVRITVTSDQDCELWVINKHTDTGEPEIYHPNYIVDINFADGSQVTTNLYDLYVGDPILKAGETRTLPAADFMRWTGGSVTGVNVMTFLCAPGGFESYGLSFKDYAEASATSFEFSQLELDTSAAGSISSAAHFNSLRAQAEKQDASIAAPPASRAASIAANQVSSRAGMDSIATVDVSIQVLSNGQ